jgi:phosphatidate cytidylyltransferase
MFARILTGVILIPVVVGLVWWAPPQVLAAVAAIIAILALIEFFNLGDLMGLRAFRKWTIACAAGLFYAQYSASLIETRSLGEGVSLVRNVTEGALSVEAVLLTFVFGAAGIGLATQRRMQEVLPAISVSSAGLLLVVLPFSYIVRLDQIDLIGRQLVLFTLCLIWAGDTFAYFVGRSLGRLSMAPVLSPKKTWEGAFANLLGSLVVAIFFARWIQQDTLSMLIVAGLANIAGQMGDLIQSAYKRGAGVKDSGSLLPGHGGVLDRIDSLILASPVVWVAFQWLSKR